MLTLLTCHNPVCVSREELEAFLSSIDAPPLDPSASLADARAAVWSCLDGDTENTEDIDGMDIAQLQSLMEELEGPLIAEDMPLAAARDTVWEFIDALASES